ncbi:MAG: cytochrome c biogenesis protein ResB [Kiritimatiellae bacterium]|nr:cytochrome c biogenesis protein ResB [Kiritimatiellia bacterium]MDW8457765.1 cytochrome c biogenesis protein ResB [Verrucomicrobiota bacterium]
MKGSSLSLRSGLSLEWLGSAKITVYGLSVLMVLTFWGTLYQVEHGLYQAKSRFFDSWIVWIGGLIPFPGTQLVLTILAVNLVVYLARLLAQRAMPFGLLLTHLGLLLLLLGGAVTRWFASESQLTLKEGEASSAAASYQHWELAVWSSDGIARDVVAYLADGLKPGDVRRFEEAGLTIEVEEYHRNARAFQSTAPIANPPLSRQGITSLRPARPAREPGENIAGAILRIRPDDAPEVRAILFGEDEVPRAFERNGTAFRVGLRRAREPLPFVVRLIDFRREMHPGTEMARHFSSFVSVSAEGVERNVLIAMNKPLRERGYTLYQASYREESDGTQWSTFAVTYNVGRLIPYVSTVVIVAGLAWHFVAMMVQQVRKSHA